LEKSRIVSEETKASIELEEIRERTDNAGRAKALRMNPAPWAVLGGILAMGLLILLLYGWKKDVMPLVMVESFMALAALAVGMVIGFLFGIPRPGLGQTNLPGQDDIAALEDNVSGSGRQYPYVYRPSTNLEQVSDWLTKIMVGVGLVEARQVGSVLAVFGTSMEAAFIESGPAVNVITQALVVVCVITGFLASFLWTRIYYGPLQTRVDQGLILRTIATVQNRLDTVSSKNEQALNLASIIAIGDLPASEEQIKQALANWPDQVREAYNTFLKAPSIWISDPVKDLFYDAPVEKDNLMLEGSISEELDDFLVIHLSVKSTSVPLKGEPITFLLHPTLTKPVRHVIPNEGIAEIRFASEGWFTAGAIVNNGQTVLSMDLRNLRNAPDWFKRD
jgi:hypothetical protein